MVTAYRATPKRRQYSRWVANETMEDFALRFTARRARRWTPARVANTAIGSISFLALEAIGAAITLTYGFDIAITAILVVGAIIFLTGLPISYYAARYGVDIDLLTRGAGFGYIGSTITSLIYASFTFIFFALEAAILALALEFCFGIPIFWGYLLSSLVVIPLVINGFSKISAFQALTQPFWVFLHLLPFTLLFFVGYDLERWATFEGTAEVEGAARMLLLGAAMGVVFSLIAQIGEQVDFLRFLPEPKSPCERRYWWLALCAAGPGWIILGVVKMIAGSYLMTLALENGVARADAADPTHLYYVAFDQVIPWAGLVMVLTGSFVILSQLKINVTNAYAGSIAWSNFFSRLTHAHPGRVVWLVFNVAIALLLMELGVFHGLEAVLGLYSHMAVAWIGALVADLVVNKPLKLSPAGIEFRRAHLYDINPVGIGAMFTAALLSIVAYTGVMGETAKAFSALIALTTAFVLAPAIAIVTRGKYYLAREPADAPKGLVSCTVCDYRFDGEDMANCPFHSGPICSLCCTLDGNCQDYCKPHARFSSMMSDVVQAALPQRMATALMSRLSRFLIFTSLLAVSFGGLLLIIRRFNGSAEFDAALTVIFGMVLIVIGIAVWMFILTSESQRTARQEAEQQTERLLREVRAHERTDRELQAAKEKAEAANDAKTRYMTGLSHELRTPLNAIYGFAQILEKSPDIPTSKRNSVTTIRRSSEHLAGLIEGLLDISRIEAGRLEILRDRIDLRVFLSQVASIFEEAAREKGIAFHFETSGSLPGWITCDEKRLRQIFINLLSNAIRYTDVGSVSLRLHYRNEVAVIEVQDTGRGIAPADIDKIWMPFQRGRNHTVPGTGLGLTITKLLVEILGGEIQVESTVGAGSLFRIRMMLPSVPNARLGAKDGEATAALQVTGIEGPRRMLMVVDDDLNHLALVSSFLEPIGFAVLTASSADLASEMLRDISPEVFVLDIDLPGRDGWSLAEELRSGDHRATPIIMVSGHALDGLPLGSRGALCDGFIAKPYNLDDLVTRVADLLKIRLLKAPDPSLVPAKSVAAVLPRAFRDELLGLAEIGHVRLLEERLAKVDGQGELVDRLRRTLESYDLDGFIAALNAVEGDHGRSAAE